MAGQSRQAIMEADAVLFLVDAHDGLMPVDTDIAEELRRLKKPVYLVVNKTDGVDTNVVLAEFFSMGLGELYPLVAAHGRGVNVLMKEVLKHFPKEEHVETKEQGIKIAIIGRPNAGKSTLVNRILGEER